MNSKNIDNLSLLDLVNYKISLMELKNVVTDLNINFSNNSNLSILYSLIDKEFVLDDIILLIDKKINSKIEDLSLEEVDFYKSYFMLEVEKLSQDDEIKPDNFYRKRNAQYTYLDMDLRLSLHKVKFKTMKKLL